MCAFGEYTDNLHFFAPKERKRGYNLRLGTVWDNPRLNHTHEGITPVRYVHQEDGTILLQAWDYTDRSYRNPKQFTKQQKRVLRKALSGQQVAHTKRDRIVFLTLTTKYEQKGYYDKTREKRIVKTQEEADFNYRSRQNALIRADRQLMKNFDRFKDYVETCMQIDRFSEWLWKNYNLDYYNKKTYDADTRGKIRRLRKENFRRFKSKLNYHLIRTAEGGGVLHLLIRKPFNYPAFDIGKIKAKWCEINKGSYQVFVKDIPYDPQKPIEENSEAMSKAFYMAGYYTYQPVVRQSSSRNWIYSGSGQLWTSIRKITGIKKVNIDLHSCPEYDPKGYIVGHYTRKTKVPNIICEKKGIIETYGLQPVSRYASKGYKPLGDPQPRKPFISNVLHVWKQILKNPPPSTYQTHLATRITKTRKNRKKGIRSKPLPKPIIRYNSFGGAFEWLLS